MKSNMKCLTKKAKNWKKDLKQRKNNPGDMKKVGNAGRSSWCTTEIHTLFGCLLFCLSCAKIKWCWPGAWLYTC